MQNANTTIGRLRAENAVLRALIVELGGTPPPAPPVGEDRRPGPSPRLPTLVRLAQHGL